MALLDIHPGRRLSGALLSLLELSPASLFSLGADRRRALDQENRLARMPPYLRDDIGVDANGRAAERADS